MLKVTILSNAFVPLENNPINDCIFKSVSDEIWHFNDLIEKCLFLEKNDTIMKFKIILVENTIHGYDFNWNLN